MPILSPHLAVSALEASSGAAPEDIEHEVLLLIASGYTYEEIAARLHQSIEAVETYVGSALRHLERRPIA